MLSIAEPRAAIIGAGPAGAAVCNVLTAAGVAHDLYDEAPRAGGNIDRRRFDAPLSAIEARATQGGATALVAGAAVTAVTADRMVEWQRDGVLARCRYDAVFLCAGAYDLAPPASGRSPRWSSAGALQALLKGQGVRPAGRTVLAGAGPFLWIVGADLVRAGTRVTHVVDRVSLIDYASLLPAAAGQLALAASFAAALVTLRRAGAGLRFGARIDRLAEDHLVLAGGATIPFDRLGITDAFAPQSQLARSAGCAQAYSPRGRYFHAATDGDGRTDRPGIFVCGEGQGVRGAPHARVSGALAACAWLADRGMAPPPGLEVGALRRRQGRFRRFGERLEAIITRRAAAIADDAEVCACERVEARAVRAAIRCGLLDHSDIKVMTRVGMGNCQGRYCEPIVCRLLAEAGRTPRAPFSQKAFVRPVLARDLADG